MMPIHHRRGEYTAATISGSLVEVVARAPSDRLPEEYSSECSAFQRNITRPFPLANCVSVEDLLRLRDVDLVFTGAGSLAPGQPFRRARSSRAAVFCPWG